MDEQFDLSGALRRIRRIADLSQRELASAACISPSTLAHAEAGTRDLPVSAMSRAAALAGLRVALLDHAGGEVVPMSTAAVTDLGGRRFPAHLDTHRADAGPRRHEPRRDRPETSFTYRRHRGGRDERRRATGTTPTDHHPVLPDDSPGDRRALRRAAAARARAQERERRASSGEFRRSEVGLTCTCLPACDELDDWSARPVHAERCPCSCDVG